MHMTFDQDQTKPVQKSFAHRLQRVGLLGLLFFLIKGLTWAALGLWLAWEIN